MGTRNKMILMIGLLIITLMRLEASEPAVDYCVIDDKVIIDIDEKLDTGRTLDITKLIQQQENIARPKISAIGLYGESLDWAATARLVVDNKPAEIFNLIGNEFRLYQIGSVPDSSRSVKLQLAGKLWVSQLEIKLASCCN